MANRDLIAIGGSSGSTAPLKALLGALDPNIQAAVLIVIHIPTRSAGLLATVAAASTRLPVFAAEDGMKVVPGNVYLGVPDHHLLVVDGHIRLGRGPRENMSRPSIDPLFRSVAVAYGPRVIGVVLSGLLNDGASGLEAIKRCGGVALVQDPDEAIANEMPLAALRATGTDLLVPSIRLGDVLSELAREPAGPGLPVPSDLRLEVDIAAGERVDSEILRNIADPAPLTCPHCSGVLSSVRTGKTLRYRCQVGHTMTAEVLAKEQENAIDEAMRVALRIIEERAELVQQMADDAARAGRRSVAEMYRERASEYRQYSDTLRRAVLLSFYASGREDEKQGQ